jgi:hypothetical protein
VKRPRRAAVRKGTEAAPPAAVHDAAERAKNMAAVLWMAWPLAAFLILAAAANRNDFDPTATRLELNWPGDVPRALATTAVETVVLALLLRPWSFRDSVWRLVVALALFVPWTVFTFATGTHVGQVIGARLFWLLVVCVSLVIGLVKVVAARIRQPPSTAHSTASTQERS